MLSVNPQKTKIMVFQKRAKKCSEQTFYMGNQAIYTGKVENLHAHVNRNLQHANPNLHVLSIYIYMLAFCKLNLHAFLHVKEKL